VGPRAGLDTHVLGKPKILSTVLTMGNNVYNVYSIRFLTCYSSFPADPFAKYSGVCYNEQFLSIKSGCYNENKCYNEREGP
jgi:hypothetical protein